MIPKTQIESYKNLEFKSKLQKQLLVYLAEHPHQTSEELSQKLGLRRSTVTARLNELLELYLIRASKTKESATSGRKNQSYCVENDYMEALLYINKTNEAIRGVLYFLNKDKDNCNFTFTKTVIDKEIKKLEKRMETLRKALRINRKLRNEI